MGALNQTERLMRTLNKQPVDRPPVICTGGMMNAAVTEVMKKTGHLLPEAHSDGKLMAELAYDIHEATGFENFGVPFCMTVEAEVLGSAINMGSLSSEPKIAKEKYPSVSNVEFKDVNQLLSSGRVRHITDAIARLSGNNPAIPVIGMLTGPISLAASVVDPMTFYRELRKNRDGAHKLLEYVSAFLGEFARLMIENGASAVAIGDPSATGEILGPKLFEEYAVRYINKVIGAIHGLERPAILHICGDLKPVTRLIPYLTADAISADAIVNLKNLKSEFPDITTMGNVSTYLLELGDPEMVSRKTRRLVLDGVNIISPACGLSTSTPLAAIQAMTKAVKGP
jgi:MtaA/CmuA family methyltransferase